MKQILLIVEGFITEEKLMKHLYDLYEIDDDRVIWSFSTHIYSFHSFLKKNYPDSNGNIDYESLDFALAFKDFIKDHPNELVILSSFDEKDFNEIILIFDYDPHVPQANNNILKEMVSNFSDIETGKLFINYPMVESYKDHSAIPDKNYLNSCIGKKDLIVVNKKNKYKTDVAARSVLNHWHSITPNVANYLLDCNKKKIEYLLSISYSPDLQSDLLDYQINSYSSQDKLYIINTSILYLYDEYGFISVKPIENNVPK